MCANLPFGNKNRVFAMSWVAVLASAALAGPPTHAQVSRTIDASAKMPSLRSGRCQALAPQGWSLTSNAEGSTADLRSPDGRMYAGWGVVAINPAMQAYYGNLYGPPATSLAFLAGAIIQQTFGDASGVRYTSQPVSIDGYFFQREFASARHQGTMYYRIYPMAGGSYVESAYFAISNAAQWRNVRAVVANVAASIRCSSRLRPSSSQSTGSGGGGGKRRAHDGADGLSNSSYNKELGTEYVHSPTTGENYLVNPATDYVNGPQGYGAYIRNGNDYIKLEPERSD